MLHISEEASETMDTGVPVFLEKSGLRHLKTSGKCSTSYALGFMDEALCPLK